MIHFQSIDVRTFLSDYWQKKPVVIRQALPDFINPLSADELAGLSLLEEVESRLVSETPGMPPYWHLKTGPFSEETFASLPDTHWTLLVQGVDRIIPEVALLLDHFNFIPQWRIDDVMISYAVKEGSVGPHYDNYDVFLYQATGRRKWSLTTQQCSPSNCLKDIDLRIMKQFTIEEAYILEPGDLLYLPPHVGHHGVSQSPDCMTYSFGYRSYQSQEVWDSFGDYLAEHEKEPGLYQDPSWTSLASPSNIPREAVEHAKQFMQQLLADEKRLKAWFGCFVTRLDSQAEQQLALPLLEEEEGSQSAFIAQLQASPGLKRDGCCRFAYQEQEGCLGLFINGCEWMIAQVSPELVKWVSDNRLLLTPQLLPYLKNKDNQRFLYELWKLQWLQWVE